ncbi:hypothetical protein Q5W_09720 [Hydrogenophaga sp. PBC]|uniref:hypothetical protein n=1 Tax=Hydrogenophaga sp. PBC TaxID=795665 RepID=UPI0008550682|nr:hypothetical protein [Hydrogenophaga sp. PBC]AOS79221.1 hypothetical protein Q5W_09720 [Hydrogenophaga sp. PBC]
MWAALASAVLQSGVLNAPEGGAAPAPPTMFSSGDWNVNLGGSGIAVQGGQAVGMATIFMVAGAAVLVAWMLRR